jgi:hypothetical protein
VNEFIEYVFSFYGVGGIYAMGATREEIAIATGVRLERRKDMAFDGDTTDRELVRDIMIERRGAA